MDCRLPIVMAMMILWSTHFSHAQSPGRCQCQKFKRSVEPRQIVSYSIAPQAANCKTREIRVLLRDEETSCLDPNALQAKRLLSCTQKYKEKICLCRLINYPNTRKCHRKQFKKRKGSHIMLRSLNK